jgi:hypothetical protein
MGTFKWITFRVCILWGVVGGPFIYGGDNKVMDNQ